jgi:hypothetical protein
LIRISLIIQNIRATFIFTCGWVFVKIISLIKIIMNKAELKKRFKKLEDFIGIDDSTGERNKLSLLAKKREKLFLSSKLKTSAGPLIEVSLVINWNYARTAKPRIDRFNKEFPEIKTIHQLDNLIKKTTPGLFLKKYFDINSSDPRNNPKYKLLRSLIAGFQEYQLKIGIDDEIEMLYHWGKQMNLQEYSKDPVGKQKGVGPGVVQNLRLCLGMQVVKPDRHVINTIKNQLKIDVKPTEFPALAKELGVSPLYLDKVLFEFGRNKTMYGPKEKTRNESNCFKTQK